MNTEVFRNPALHAMRALVLSAFDRIEWRHHGIGVLQGYIRENSEPEVRVHVWSRKLLKPGIDESGDVHDHRFDMISHVLCGSVEHEELTETWNPGGAHAMMALTHARAASETLYHGPVTNLAGRYSVHRKQYTIHEGWSYSFPAQRFHHSPLPESSVDVAVTCVEKHRQQEAPARLLYPIDHEPVMAFGHNPNPDVVHDVLSAAKDRLRA